MIIHCLLSIGDLLVFGFLAFWPFLLCSRKGFFYKKIRSRGHLFKAPASVRCNTLNGIIYNFSRTSVKNNKYRIIKLCDTY